MFFFEPNSFLARSIFGNKISMPDASTHEGATHLGKQRYGQGVVHWVPDDLYAVCFEPEETT